MAFFTARFSKLLGLIRVLLFCFIFLQEPAAALQHANSGLMSRKVLVGKNEYNGKVLVGSELRTAPAGPNPLHHNGGTPKKKPRAP